jgi:methylated-DNA-[protein]-cysteine S-methyltransferase
VKNSIGVGTEYSVFETGWGWMSSARSTSGLTALVLPQPSKDEALDRLPAGCLKGKQNAEAFEDLSRRMQEYFAGKHVVFNDAVDLASATPFQRSVWLKTREVVYGQSRSYSWLGSAIGKPGACRAVGQALGRNPLPIVIPCHRILTADGKLGGFSGGLNIKRELLDLEGIAFLGPD